MNCCDNPDPRPFDLIPGWVEAHNVEFIADDGDGKPTLTYDPTGYTEVEWDEQTTIGVICQYCWEPTIVEQWLESFIQSIRPRINDPEDSA